VNRVSKEKKETRVILDQLDLADIKEKKETEVKLAPKVLKEIRVIKATLVKMVLLYSKT